MSAEATAFALCRTDKRVLSSVIVRQVQDDICEIKAGGSTSGLARTAAGGAATCHAERVDATARKKGGNARLDYTEPGKQTQTERRSECIRVKVLNLAGRPSWSLSLRYIYYLLRQVAAPNLRLRFFHKFPLRHQMSSTLSCATCRSTIMADTDWSP